MQISIKLESPVSTSFRCQKAANSLDIDTATKSVHELNLQADLQSEFRIGLIVGSSGSGKTTLAKHVYGDSCFAMVVNPEIPIIDQFPKSMTYDECAEALAGIGLTSVPCWIRPAKTLSNGQLARAQAALSMASSDLVIIDEWTSVVDRTVAKVMSHCVKKYAQRHNKKIILLSCHYDVIDWLEPDWIIDCNKASFSRRVARLREPIEFKVYETDKCAWRYFSKYHYLSAKLPGGANRYFGLFHGLNQVGFICYSSYMAGQQYIKHFNRLVIHPDYAGFGLGIRLLDETARFMASKGFYVRGTFSSIPVYKLLMKSQNWRYLGEDLKVKKEPLAEARENRSKFSRKSDSVGSTAGFRSKVRMFKFDYIGPR